MASWGQRLLVATALTCLVACGGEPKGPDPIPTPEAQTPSLAEQSQDLIDLHANADGPGCSAAVAQQGEVVWRGAQGLADLESGTAITPETVFDIGSVSKQFTAAAILFLQDAGKLRLQDPLADYLSSFPAWSEKTTLDHLMHHTSGIPTHEPLLQEKGFELTDRTTQAQAVDVLAAVRKLEFTPGSDWAYSNSNYVLLGEVVRRVSGQALPRYLKVNVFDPLELDMVVEPTAAIPERHSPTGEVPGSSKPSTTNGNRWATARSRRHLLSWLAGETTTEPVGRREQVAGWGLGRRRARSDRPRWRGGPLRGRHRPR